jgi:lactoylglutathione lyase
MKILYVILTLVLFSSVKKSMAQTQNKQQIAVLNHIAVYVADLHKATEFYENVFNLQQVPEPFNLDKHTWFSLGSVAQLHLIKGAQANERHQKNNHLCFSVASIEDFIATLNDKNIAYENWVGTAKSITLRVDGVKQIYFKDPDGHWLEVNDAK